MISRRDFIKLLGGTLAAAGVTYSTASLLFPDSPKPQQKTLQEALAELTERQDHEGIIRLLGSTYNESGALIAVSPGFTFCLVLGASLVELVRAARKLRSTPEVGPLLSTLKQALMTDTTKYIEGQPVISLAAEYEAAKWLKKDPTEVFVQYHGREEGPRLLAEYRKITGAE